jgi:hypothetical protein
MKPEMQRRIVVDPLAAIMERRLRLEALSQPYRTETQSGAGWPPEPGRKKPKQSKVRSPRALAASGNQSALAEESRRLRDFVRCLAMPLNPNTPKGDNL